MEETQLDKGYSIFFQLCNQARRQGVCIARTRCKLREVTFQGDKEEWHKEEDNVAKDAQNVVIEDVTYLEMSK